MTVEQSLKYNPAYLLGSGYRCYRQIWPDWERIEVEYKAFYSSMSQANNHDCFHYIFVKGSIEIWYGLSIVGRPPELQSIRINNKWIWP